MTHPDDVAELCSDAELGYLRSRTNFEASVGLQMDEAYRLAHLPLVAPHHHGVIPRHPRKDYDHGVHTHRIFSLVLPVAWEALADSAEFQKMQAEARILRFGRKISWDAAHERRHKLHATICGSLSSQTAPAFDTAQQRALRAVGPIRYELRGIFSGSVNVGRLYLKLYPQRSHGGNAALQDVQRILGAKITDIYLVGIYNFIDDLTPQEANELRLFIDRWWDVPLYRGTSTNLALLGTMDDLALNSTLVARVPHA